MSCRPQRGFTLIESLVILSLVALVGGFGLLVSMDDYRGNAFRSDRDMLVALLQRARSQAINNICTGTGCTDGAPHGVHIQSDSYIAFVGTTYSSADTRSIRYDAQPSVSRQGGDIVFSQLSATTTATSTTLSDTSGHMSTIRVTADGAMSWTN